MKAVQDAVGEFTLPDEDTVRNDAAAVLVEARVIGPGTAVDVEDERVAIAFEVLDPLQLPDSLVDEPGDRHRLDLARAGEIEVSDRARVVEESRREQNAFATRGAVWGAEARKRIVLRWISVLDRRAVKELPPTRAVGLVEDDVAHRVAVDVDDPRVIRSPGHDHGAVRALVERLGDSVGQVHAQRGNERLLPRFDGEVRRLRLVVDVREMRASAVKRLCRERLRETAFDGDHVRHVVLVPVRIDHHDDLPEPGQDVEQMSSDELRVLECSLRRQERLRDASVSLHRVEAQVAREVRDEVEPIRDELGLEEEPRGKQRLDPIRR